eukprot:TRINITY_DN6670_c0_g1_i1.p1 TRINITY_DN6670_c0_g1~~TRINITY_DN6670_c0_g1_i1.p1  ORF type:complete len:182 (-),score=30.86 TRINITY_DN6670_c0_g1_i1:57-602(-)
MVVWSTGIGPRRVVSALDVPKTKNGRIIVDSHLKVTRFPNVSALGDCGQIEDMPLAATAQVAQQQGKYLAKRLNAEGKGQQYGPFKFIFRGIMLYAGRNKSVVDTPFLSGYGFVEWIMWRSVYLTSLGSLLNKFQVPAEWLRTLLWGRDITSFGDDERGCLPHHPTIPEPWIDDKKEKEKE